VRALPGVAGLDLYRYVPILYRGLPAHIQAVDAATLQRFSHFRWLRGGDEHWDAVRRGAVVVTESFSRRFGVRAGGRVVLEGRDGPRDFPVEAVFYDYTSEHGVVLMDRATYLSLSGDHTINTVGVYLEPGHPQRDATGAAILRLAAARGFPAQRREELHRGIRAVFDATFAVTRSLRLLAVITAFFGIAGALLTLFTERRREFGIFRALGFSSGQVVGVTLLEGLGLGLASFALSAVSGTVVAVLLIRVINLRSFHWTVFFHPAWETYAVAAALAVGASLAAAAYPAWLVRRTYPQIQLREE
jgi:putative ABC transport system permease protein